MQIELNDMDVLYGIATRTNADGKDYVAIMPRIDIDERDEDYEICLDYEQCQQLIRTLTFIANEINPHKPYRVIVD